MLKNKIRKFFKMKDEPDIEFEAQVFGEKKNNVSVVLGSSEELKANHVAFVLGYVLIELCKDCGLEFQQVIKNVFDQIKETDEGLN